MKQHANKNALGIYFAWLWSLLYTKNIQSEVIKVSKPLVGFPIQCYHHCLSSFHLQEPLHKCPTQGYNHSYNQTNLGLLPSIDRIQRVEYCFPIKQWKCEHNRKGKKEWNQCLWELLIYDMDMVPIGEYNHIRRSLNLYWVWEKRAWHTIISAEIGDRNNSVIVINTHKFYTRIVADVSYINFDAYFVTFLKWLIFIGYTLHLFMGQALVSLLLA